jgi:phosphoribosylglycinamide formyltransferase-1
VPTAVLVSGAGTNLEAVIAASRSGELPLDIRVVVSNNATAYALERARRAGIQTLVRVFDKTQMTRADYARGLARELLARGVRLVLLLGWMHVLAADFLDAGFEGVLNLHPAYLPEDPSADSVIFPDGTVTSAFRGPHALRDALAAGVAWTGASLIQITPLVDRGPVLARRAMRLEPGESEDQALARLHLVEQAVVREGVLHWLAQRSKR